MRAMSVHATDTQSLVAAVRRATVLLLQRAAQLDHSAQETETEFDLGRRKAARASAAATLGELEELGRMLHATSRLVRGVIGSLDYELTQHADSGLESTRLVERRMGDRRSPFSDRRRAG
jgi:hypothetical protein